MAITPEQFAALTLEDAAAGVVAGWFTAAELLEASIARMDAFEPVINSIITRNDRQARELAAAFDSRSVDSQLPLGGTPIAVKDCIMTRGLRTTSASRILENFIPPYDATVVKKLHDAGAVVTAKTNMDEFAMGSSGENSAYGPTRNPWDHSRVPGGSSSGSAALVAYGGALAALGSDTGGSIRQPASFCGLVGIKPTYGRVSRNGVAALASSLDQVGPITRTVRDNALLFDVLSGHDPMDSTSTPQASDAAPCLPDIETGCRGLRVGFDPALRDKDGFSPANANAYQTAIEIIRAGGAQIREVSIPLIDYGVAAYYIICSCEASTNLARYDGVRYGVRRDDGDLWRTYAETRGRGFGDEVKRRIMMGAYALSKGYYDAYYLNAARVRGLFAREFGRLFQDVDVIVMPVTPQQPRLIGARSTPLEDYLGDLFTLPANLTGFPALAFPVGVFDGLPTGVQAMAAPFREDILYRAARQVEKNIDIDNAPWMRPLSGGKA